MSSERLQEASQTDRRAGFGRTSARRVAHVLRCQQIGGVEIATLRVAKALEEGDEFHSIAFCHGGETDVARLFAEQGIETTGYETSDYSYRRAGPFLIKAMRLAAKLRRQRIDLVHCSDLSGAYHVGLAARLARIPIICHIRSNFEQIPTLYKPPLLTINHFVFVSKSTWQHFNTIFHVPSHRGSVIYDWAPLSMEPSRYAAASSRIRCEFGIPPSAPVIGMVARVAPQKDYKTLIAATVEILASRPDAHLLLVGEHTEPQDCRVYHRQLSELIERMGLTKKVTWTGFRRDVPELMMAMDVVVLSSQSEGFPLTLLEAMSLGRPVVTTRVGGIPEIIADGENGLLHEASDAVGLGRQILRVLEDETLASALRHRGRESVLRRFTKERTIAAISQTYGRLLCAN